MFNNMKNLLIKISVVTALLVSFQAHTAVAKDMSEAAKKTRYFLKWDQDGDQKLNSTEYAEMVKVQFENKGNDGWEEAARKRFKRKDANKDGLVTFEEQFEGMQMAQ